MGTKISALTAAGAATLADLIAVVQGGNSRKMTLEQARDLIGVRASTLSADHAISTIAGTEVGAASLGDAGAALEVGTYQFTYYILAQSATTTVSPMFGVNFTGTAAVRAMKLRYPSTGTTAISGVADDVGATSGQTEESMAQTAFSTTAPNMGAVGGVATAAANILYIIEGILVVTVAGDLELWHGSETATSTTVKAGSMLTIVKAQV